MTSFPNRHAPESGQRFLELSWRAHLPESHWPVPLFPDPQTVAAYALRAMALRCPKEFLALEKAIALHGHEAMRMNAEALKAVCNPHFDPLRRP